MLKITLIILLCPLIGGVFGQQSSLYLKTMVIEDKCSNFGKLEEGYMGNYMMCSLLCSDHEECRRFLYNTVTGICSLYHQGKNCIVGEGSSTGYVCFRKRYTCLDGSCTCPIGFYGPGCENVIQRCMGNTITWPGFPGTGFTFIQPRVDMEPFEVFCSHSNMWLNIQSQYYKCSRRNFNRVYQEYVDGFGSTGAVWLGLEKIRAIVESYPSGTLSLSVLMRFTTAKYTSFSISDASSGYTIRLGQRDGGPVDGFLAAPSINNTKFSTYDLDHTSHNCPARFGGGFWYADDPDCCQSDVNGLNIHWAGDSQQKVTMTLWYTP